MFVGVGLVVVGIGIGIGIGMVAGVDTGAVVVVVVGVVAGRASGCEGARMKFNISEDNMDLSLLAVPFAPHDIEWRIGRSGIDSQTGNPWASVLAYVTNRAIMQRLDEVCGIGGWKNEYCAGPQGGVLCGLSIKIGDEWITKWDGAANTEVKDGEKMDVDTNIKGGLSASMKRAGAQWGIGRYLYGLDQGYAIIGQGGKYRGTAKAKDQNAKPINFYWNPPPLPEWALPKKPTV